MTMTDGDERPELPEDEVVATALWCMACMLPSGIRILQPITHPAGRVLNAATVDVCLDCEGFLDPEGHVIG